MPMFYVATLARYVLVEAVDETQARQVGLAALHDLYAELREKLGREVPIDIHTIRKATEGEIGLWTWHHNMLASEVQATIPRPGDRIRLLAMQEDPDPVPAGQLGTIVDVRRYDDAKGVWHQIDVAWDSGRTLMLVSPPDRFEIIQADGTHPHQDTTTNQ